MELDCPLVETQLWCKNIGFYRQTGYSSLFVKYLKLHIMCYITCFILRPSRSPVGLFELRVEQYLDELPETEQGGVNRFFRGLGEMLHTLLHTIHMK